MILFLVQKIKIKIKMTKSNPGEMKFLFRPRAIGVHFLTDQEWAWEGHIWKNNNALVNVK